MRYASGFAFIACVALFSCNGEAVDLGRDSTEGPVAEPTDDSSAACSVDSLAKGADAPIEAIDKALQRRWVSCGRPPTYAIEVLPEGIVFGLRHLPNGTWERDLSSGAVEYHLSEAPGAPKGRWAFEIAGTGGVGPISLPVYGYFTNSPLRLVLSNGQIFTPMP